MNDETVKTLEPIGGEPRCVPPVNAMSVDVEDYFQVSAFETHIDRARWTRIPGRVEASMDRVLALFELAGIHATFFTLGWVAERYPQIVRRIVAGGHELASHGMNHVRVTHQDRATFAADVRQSKDLLEQAGGVAVAGYRAASYSIGRENIWALDVLRDAGFTYSSSIYPGVHDAYGMPEAPRFACRYGREGIVEIPVTTGEIAGRRVPCAGGGFFRLYPYAVTRALLNRVNRKDRQPALFYFHPWEVDPEQPRVPGLPLATRTRHYLNLHRVENRLGRLLQDFRWDRMDRVFTAINSSTAQAPVEPIRNAG